jgi:ABC-2 type transport system ATP-binding protein/ribosome-dependent ATPase
MTAASAATPPAAAAAGPLALCDGVSRRFGEFTVVSEVSLAVRAGEIVGLLGANGAGKTTLIRMLLGLLPASAGEVLLFGAPPSRGTRRRIGYVPQGLGLYDDLTPEQNMEFSAAAFGGGRGELPASLRTYAGTPVGSLPLGVQRRVAFAQALSHHPELLILDEPTSGVDPLGRARLWDTIAGAAAAGAGVLVTTHYMEEAGECTRLVIMSDGRVVAQGTAPEIIGAAQVTVVATPAWADAFRALAEAWMPVALAGRALRVSGAEPAEVRRVLTAAGGAASEQARVSTAPATLEERFFQLAQPGFETEAKG